MSSEKPDGNKKEGAELLASLALFLVSAFFLYHSFLLEKPDGEWGTAPGLLPAVLSASLCVMSGWVVVTSLRRGALAALAGGGGGGGLKGFLQAYWRLLVAMAGAASLYFVFLRFLPFEISAILFFLFMTGVFWPDVSWPRRIAVSVAIPIVIALVFQAGFGIPLPGEGNLIEQLVYELRR